MNNNLEGLTNSLDIKRLDIKILYGFFKGLLDNYRFLASKKVQLKILSSSKWKSW